MEPECSLPRSQAPAASPYHIQYTIDGKQKATFTLKYKKKLDAKLDKLMKGIYIFSFSLYTG
jgi:hypothetical protein